MRSIPWNVRPVARRCTSGQRFATFVLTPHHFRRAGHQANQSEKMMKKLMMLSAVAALLVGGSALAAGPDDPTIQIKAPSTTYKLYNGEFKDFAHNYALSNDKYIRFTQSGRQYWARLHGENKVQLYPIAANVFVTAAGARVEFQEQGDQVVISNYERLPMAVAMSETNVRVVARR
jgi:hypothetical protein